MTKSTGIGRGKNPASHQKRASGRSHYRWNDERMLSEHGYVKVRVGKDHQLADANGYCYEHLLVWVSAGRERPAPGQLLHHRNEVKTDNRLKNLQLLDRVAHAAEHYSGQMLTDSQVRTVRERFAAGEDGTALASEFGVPFQRIYRIVKGETRLGAGGPIQLGSLRGRKKS
jgi:hypothetical protein